MNIPDLTPHLITSLANFEFTMIEHDFIGSRSKERQIERATYRKSDINTVSKERHRLEGRLVSG